MASKNCYQGKLLRVNLTDKTTTVEDISQDSMTNYLGGRGLGAYYLYKEVPVDTEPLSVENKLMFFNGPMAGTMAPGTNKICVSFKSPLTNTYSYSLCGGHFGPELKFAGYDGLIVEGKSDTPVYLWIADDQVELRSAEKIWGQQIPQTATKIREQLGGDLSIKVACIGPAGENLNKMACITADRHREFGRGGAGAVMGWKNLKAIAIRGSRDIKVAEPAKMVKRVKELYSEFKEHPKVYARRYYGTVEMLEGINKLGFWSTKNFSEGYFAPGEEMTGPKMREDIVVNDCACYGCTVACSKVSAVDSAKYGRIHLEGPEFETVGLLGANCGISDWEVLLKATEICDYYGMDTMAAGATISFMMECYEKGIVTKEQCDGLELKFGNGDAMIQLLEKIAKREGVGHLLAEGVKIASEELGAPHLAMHSKGLPLATYDPRGAKGMAVTYATSPKGAHHMMSPTMGVEIAGDRFADSGKASVVKDVQMQMALVDSLGYCATMRFVLNVDKQLELLNMATGWDMSKEEFLEITERIINIERLYNVKKGMSRADDQLPQRFLKEAMKSGASAHETIDFELMLDEYYEQMGWDNSGKPTAEKLKHLKLDVL